MKAVWDQHCAKSLLVCAAIVRMHYFALPSYNAVQAAGMRTQKLQAHAIMHGHVFSPCDMPHVHA